MKPALGPVSVSITRAILVVGLSAAALLQAAQPVSYYDSADTASGAALRSSLNDVVTAGSVRVGYGNTNPALYVTDEDPANVANVIMIYGGDSRPKSGSSGTADSSATTGGWNREHGFPQSFYTEDEPMRSDLHALFPCDVDINTRRSNHPYGVVNSPTYTDAFGNEDSGGIQALFEPTSADRGRVARAILFMDIRYEGETTEPDLTVVNTYPAGTGAGQMAYLSTLLDWHRQYPPTAFERARNAKVYNRQKNANPFVDRPEWAATIYGGTAWSMANGDTVTVSGTNRAAASSTAGALDVPMLSLDLALPANQFHVGQIGVSNLGTASDSEIAAVKLWWDVDGNGMATSADQLLDTRTLSGGAAAFDLTSHPFYVAPGTMKLLLTTSVGATITNGDTIALRVDANSILPHASGGTDTAPVFGAIDSGTMTITSGLSDNDALSGVAATSRAPLSAVAGASDVALMSLTLTLTSNQWDLGQLDISSLGTATDSDVTQFTLYRDADNDGVVDGTDPLLAAAVPLAGSATLTLETPYRITAGSTNFLLAAAISPTAVQDRTLGVRIVANGISHSSTGGNDIDPVTGNLDSGLLAIQVPTGSAEGVFISEVFEGNGGSLKYVELYNGGSTTVNLASPQLTLRRYSNGSLSFASINLSGSLAPGGYHVVVNNEADMITYFGSADLDDQISGSISHNGNDVYDLYQAGSPGTVIDSFGADLAGTSTDFAANVVAFRIFDQMPNTGAWGAATQPAAGGNSPSGYWATRTVTTGNANASSIATPGAGHGAEGAEVPVSLTAFHLE